MLVILSAVNSELTAFSTKRNIYTPTYLVCFKLILWVMFQETATPERKKNVFKCGSFAIWIYIVLFILLEKSECHIILLPNNICWISVINYSSRKAHKICSLLKNEPISHLAHLAECILPSIWRCSCIHLLITSVTTKQN